MEYLFHYFFGPEAIIAGAFIVIGFLKAAYDRNTALDIEQRKFETMMLYRHALEQERREAAAESVAALKTLKGMKDGQTSSGRQEASPRVPSEPCRSAAREVPASLDIVPPLDPSNDLVFHSEEEDMDVDH